MRSRSRCQEELPGQDSFLDIVGNMVGILIILVLAVGVRAGRSLARQQQEPAAEQAADRSSLAAAALLSGVVRLGRRSFGIRREVAERNAERNEWETLVLAVQREIDRRRRDLDEQARAEYDVQQELARAKQRLDQIIDDQISMDSVQPETVQIVSRPTPLGRTVAGEELHFQLRSGRLARIPLDELLERLRSTARHKAWKLETQSHWTDTVGPVDGFRLRYVMERVDLPVEVQMQTGRTGSIIRLARWQLLPVSSHLGEPVADALRGASQLNRTLAAQKGRQVALTVWTYPDSFAELRDIKDELQQRGYAVAVRPLPDGVPIGGSPDGSRSVAQ
ncbi:MAG: hypothetical protein BMS9Abin04_022 [Planctomycetia bacterium]|nr:MAG: hypothetical protein BMS9Abin04_022 [Planctomycetia bacterium]